MDTSRAVELERAWLIFFAVRRNLSFHFSVSCLSLPLALSHHVPRPVALDVFLFPWLGFFSSLFLRRFYLWALFNLGHVRVPLFHRSSFTPKTTMAYVGREAF